MKPMNDNNNNNNNNNTSWLGFSLSPHMSMEQNQPQPTSSSLPSSLQSNFFLSPHFNNPALCYGVENGAAAAFYNNQLSFMPLKSDGSLCIMQGMVQTESSPKLEDFLGCGPNMGTHEYSNNDHTDHAMALSLDSMYYSQNSDAHEENRGDSSQTLEHHLSSYFQPAHEMTNWANGLNGEVGFGDLETLSLSMISPPPAASVAAAASKKRGAGKGGQKQPVHRKSIDTFGQRTSQFRGVTRHRWTGRYEAHLWDNSCKKEGQTRKGRQVYLGGYDMEEKAARAYDLAALKYWGPSTHVNFPLENYRHELEEMKNMSRQEYVAHLRRRSSGFSRGASIYRGVTRHHQHGRWQARIGRVSGNKDLYLGTFSTQEEAAEAYDVAAIKFRGLNAVTNFEISRYNVEKIMNSNALLPIEFARRIKPVENGNSNNNNVTVAAQIEHQPFSTDFVGINDDLGKIGSNHVSNSSSLVTSLSSSAEASPVSSWIQMAQVPVFAAWADIA